MAPTPPRKYFPRPMVIGLLVCLPLGLQCHDGPAAADWHWSSPSVRPSGIFKNLEGTNELVDVAAEKPLEFLKYCRQRYDNQVTDYRCLFSKQETLATGLTLEQLIGIRFRQEPFSVDMKWIKNAGRAQRVSYVSGRWSENDKDLAQINPSGVAGLLVPGGVRRDIHSSDVRASSRRSIDQFGFANALDLIIKYCVQASGDPAYSLRYVGQAYLDKRPCLVFERTLPYEPGDDQYPDKVLEIYIDKTWLLPTGCIAYADTDKTNLLGKYIYTNVKFNVGLTDADF